MQPLCHGLQLFRAYKDTPSLLLKFVTVVLKPVDSHHLTTEHVSSLPESFAHDIIFGVRYLFDPYAYICWTLFAWHDRSKVIKYYIILQIETAEAKYPLLLTFFGTITLINLLTRVLVQDHISGISFQEEIDSIIRRTNTSIGKSKRTSLIIGEPKNTRQRKTGPKRNPPKFCNDSEAALESERILKSHFHWKIALSVEIAYKKVWLGDFKKEM